MEFSKWAVVAELFSGICFMVSALFLSGMTGAVIGTDFQQNRTYGLAFLVLAVSAASLFILFKRKTSKDIKTWN
ncbi:MAG: hypothetical protein AABX11_02525 [Nanoarchaeota archaeon]